MDKLVTNKFIKANKKPLSPAKKFRLKLRRAKFRKFQQAKEQYFEHDNRTVKSVATRPKRYNKKTRQAQKYVAAYLNKSMMNQNGDNINRNETQESSSNFALVKADENFSSPQRSAFHILPREQATHKTSQNLLSSNPSSSLKFTTNTSAQNVEKCCCHCACSTGISTTVNSKRKPRRKLSSPYFGEFSQLVGHGSHFTAADPDLLDADLFNGSDFSTTHHTIVKSQANSDEFLQIRKASNLIRFQMLKRELNLQSQDNDCNIKEVRSITRFVWINLHFDRDSNGNFEILESREK